MLCVCQYCSDNKKSYYKEKTLKISLSFICLFWHGFFRVLWKKQNDYRNLKLDYYTHRWLVIKTNIYHIIFGFSLVASKFHFRIEGIASIGQIKCPVMKRTIKLIIHNIAISKIGILMWTSVLKCIDFIFVCKQDKKTERSE